MEWLVDVFDKETRDLAQGRWRFLIVDGHYSHVTIEFLEYCEAHQILPFCLPPHSTHLLQPLDVGLLGPLQHLYSHAIDNAIRNGVHGINKGNFLPLYLEARRLTCTKANIQTAFSTCGILPLNARILIGKLPFQRRPHLAHDNAKDVLLKVPPTPLVTPQNSGAIARLIRQTKLQDTKHNDHTVREDLLNNLIYLLARFGISRDRYQELVERTFQQWREANKLNTKVDGRHLGTKTDKLARVLDGKEIAKHYEAREKKDVAKQQRRVPQSEFANLLRAFQNSAPEN